MSADDASGVMASETGDAVTGGTSRTIDEQIAGGWRWLGPAAAGVLLASVGLFVLSGHVANGEFTYPLDDPYIHLGLAANLGEDLTLGINPGEFASAGSSTLWPLLLAVPAALLGPLVGIPLVLSLLVGVVAVLLLDRWAVRRGLRPAVRAAFLAALLLAVPMVLMSLIGMEHVLQIAFAFFLVDAAVDVMVDEEPTPRTRLFVLGALAFGLSTVRLEALFVVAVLGLMLLVRRRVMAAITIGVGAALPILAMVAINLGQGWPPLPASILAKTVTEYAGLARYLPHPQTYTLFRTPRLVAVVVLVIVMLALGRRLRGRFDPRARQWGIAALGIFAVHLCFGMFGWLYRYEAYLIALCIGALALGSESLLRHRAELRLTVVLRAALAIGLIALAALVVVDGLRIHLVATTGMREIREQQREMARFTAAACPGCRVVVNDIGIVSRFGDVTVTDAVGLANRDVVEQKIDGTYDAGALDWIARAEGAQMAMVYPNPPWVPGIPDSWIKIGDWTYAANEVVGGKVVSIYVIDPAVEERVRSTFDDWDTQEFYVSEPA